MACGATATAAARWSSSRPAMHGRKRSLPSARPSAPRRRRCLPPRTPSRPSRRLSCGRRCRDARDDHGPVARGLARPGRNSVVADADPGVSLVHRPRRPAGLGLGQSRDARDPADARALQPVSLRAIRPGGSAAHGRPGRRNGPRELCGRSAGVRAHAGYSTLYDIADGHFGLLYCPAIGSTRLPQVESAFLRERLGT